jgi:hypothetical protein
MEPIDRTSLQPQHEDTITWTPSTNGEYSTSSAYRAQFSEFPPSPALAMIWKTWAPPKCKFFAWLILQDRVWTSERLARRNWDHCPICPLCKNAQETALHIATDCKYTCCVWTAVATWIGTPELLPSEWRPSTSTMEWWVNVSTAPGVPCKGSRSVALLVGWEVWKERNNRVFDQRELPSIINRIKAEASLWIAAGAKCLAAFFTRE